jgi:hypothetical protein
MSANIPTRIEEELILSSNLEKELTEVQTLNFKE